MNGTSEALLSSECTPPADQARSPIRKPVPVSTLLACVATGLSLLTSPAWSQTTNACDLNQDQAVNATDAQLAINMAVGSAPCNANVYGSGVCNVVVVQRVINAALGGTCVTGTGSTAPHSVSLTWTASTSSNVTGYHVYRGTASGGPYAKVTSSPLVSATAFTDHTVQAGQTYFYVATAVDNTSTESANSNEARAVIPSP